MRHKVTLIPGEGIGPEVAAATRRILEAAGVQIDWEELEGRTDKTTERGQLVNQLAVESVRKNHVALKGPMATAIAGGAPSVNVALRKTLDLYANLRPVKNLPGVKSHFDNVDLIIVRENTEDLYSGLEHEVVPGVVESLKIITEKASTRIARFAFEYAKRHSRKKIHAIHKANIMKLSDGLFLRSVRAVAAQFPDIEYKELIVDNACMQIVMDPQQFDVLLLPNLYGDVMSDLAAGLVGGLGVVPSANIGDDCAMFEAVHGTAPDIAGKGFAYFDNVPYGFANTQVRADHSDLQWVYADSEAGNLLMFFLFLQAATAGFALRWLNPIPYLANLHVNFAYGP